MTAHEVAQQETLPELIGHVADVVCFPQAEKINGIAATNIKKNNFFIVLQNNIK